MGWGGGGGVFSGKREGAKEDGGAGASGMGADETAKLSR